MTHVLCADLELLYPFAFYDLVVLMAPASEEQSSDRRTLVCRSRAPARRSLKGSIY